MCLRIETDPMIAKIKSYNIRNVFFSSVSPSFHNFKFSVFTKETQVGPVGVDDPQAGLRK